MKKSEVKTHTKAILDKLGIYYVCPSTTGYKKSAIPDIIACVSGTFLAFNCIGTGKLITPIQVAEFNNIVSSHGIAFTVDSQNILILENTLTVIQQMKEGLIHEDEISTTE
jgi:hypothetical protein